MKKTILLAIAIAHFTSSCSNDESTTPTAPTIISADGTKNFPSTGLVSKSIFTTGATTIPTAGENQTFNYSSVTVQSPYTSSGGNVSNVAFPSATSTLSAATNFLGASQSTPVVYYYEASSSSLSRLGEKYDATNITFPGVGSVTFPEQSVVYSSAQKMAEFPMSFNQNGNQSLTATTNFTVDSPALPAPNVPARYIDAITVSTSNFSWGTITIPGYTNSMKTLVQKTTETIQRNYYLMNSTGGFDPMPAQLLTAVGITDGAIVTNTNYRYWVEGKGFVMIQYADGSGTIINGL